jgi:hypothetical protein
MMESRLYFITTIQFNNLSVGTKEQKSSLFVIIILYNANR